jgi:ribosomal protein S18 acetylase RimI-like enzyme
MVMYTLRPVTAADYAFLYDLYVGTMKPSVAQVWGWDEAAQAERFREHFEPATQRIVVVDGQDIGMLVVEERPSELFLANLRILPMFQGQGWGTRIIRDLLARARDAGVPMTLQVLKPNHSARRLYERLGFRITEATPTHYRMSTQLPDVPAGA